MPIKNRFAELLPEITEWRHDIHAHPELLFDTHRTAALVAEKLREFGCDEVVTGIAKNGVVGVIRGRTNRSGRTIGLRADMDALPINEETGVEYASQTPGVMHACGHDGHTAMLLGAAKYLAETRNFDGTAVVIFQPAEEGGGGGKVMCDEGLMERFGIDEVYGMHNWPGRPVGSFAIRPGPFFAAADQFEIEIEGKGGHAAKPHEAVDSTVVAAHVVIALQTIASRNVDPVKQVVVSVTSFETSSTTHNVIPQKVLLKGTVRTLDAEVRDLAEARLKALAEGTAAAFGAVARVNYMRGYPVMVNSEAETAFAAEVARKVSGDCEEAPLVMGGEDFAYMLEKRPGAYILVGNGDTASVHHPRYNFNDEVIPAGCSWFAEIVESRLPVSG
ncbi:hippurate hydrolase [Meinhardsimonia xiamenensis]|jgi:hippurate hydrolase|uniref:Hippurate hydrolase n=1 Tax=Meinhardsimonia xiamenensis TaxID=990712 RepID=A0A1G9BMA6_9RHOB|nr:M20 aminoacylase family protein [Meinhardsimonia xiamenensis]PRX34923.1 hippurate hydrolase [Meinhardsimonia xiamenensis]SDK40626.1 hippurate hydrolase [Meinhardsimonia xiamenensis]